MKNIHPLTIEWDFHKAGTNTLTSYYAKIDNGYVIIYDSRKEAISDFRLSDFPAVKKYGIVSINGRRV